MAPGISIVIPTWNGLALLRRNLPSVLSAARCFRRCCAALTEVIVVDDGSTDATTEILPREFPEVKLITRDDNAGFAPACNLGFEHCRFPLVALLNNDVRVEEDYFNHQVDHFADPKVFAVTAKVFELEPPIFSAGGRFGRFRRGFWSVYFNYDLIDPQTADWVEGHRLLSAYAIGGFATYDRAKLCELGGFNDLLSPFHWEDVDLSYRAWKRGWEVHYEPRSRAHHQISATIDAHYDRASVETVSFRNRLLMHWINLHSPTFLISHLFMLAVLFSTRILVLDFSFYRAFLDALRRLPQALRLRKLERRRARRSDAQVARLLNRFYESAPIRIYYSRQQVLEHHPESRQAGD